MQREVLNEANWVAVTDEPDGSRSFVYRPYGTPGIIVFFIVFLTFWGAFLLAMLLRGIAASPWLIALFAVAESGGAFFLLWMILGRSRLRLTAHDLVLERGIGKLRRTKRIPRKLIREIRQVDDRAQQSEPDSFPTFTLKVIGETECAILSRQDGDRSDYLGSEIAQWAGVPYGRSAKPS